MNKIKVISFTVIGLVVLLLILIVVKDNPEIENKTEAKSSLSDECILAFQNLSALLKSKNLGESKHRNMLFYKLD